MNDLIVVEQLPIIKEKLRQLSEQIDRRISGALALVATEETVKTIKSIRADMNKECAAYEAQRKAVKKAVMEPYDAFEAVYKECVSDKFRAADNALRDKVESVEGEIKRKKRDSLKAYFDEYRLSRGVDFANLDTWNPNVTLTATLTALKKEGKAYVDRICDDLALIDTQEHKVEILVEYRRSLNVSQAITAVTERHKAVEEQKKRQEEAEARHQAERDAVAKIEAAMPMIAKPLAPPAEMPAQEDDPVMTLSFRVTAKRSELRALKKFLQDGGYHYE